MTRTEKLLWFGLIAYGVLIIGLFWWLVSWCSLKTALWAAFAVSAILAAVMQDFTHRFFWDEGQAYKLDNNALQLARVLLASAVWLVLAPILVTLLPGHKTIALVVSGALEGFTLYATFCDYCYYWSRYKEALRAVDLNSRAHEPWWLPQPGSALRADTTRH
jgi:hypothetical protein